MTTRVKNFNAVSWLTSRGYDVSINDVDNIHTLSKGNAKIQLNGKWTIWANYLSRKHVQCLLYKMHYVSQLNPDLQFNLARRDNWNDLIMTTQKEWLARPKNLLQRTLECAEGNPSTKQWSFTPYPQDTSRTDVGIKYYLTEDRQGKPLKLSMEALIPGKNPPYAELTSQQILELANIPESVESLLGETWSQEWWTNLRKLAQINQPSIQTYLLPEDDNLAP